MWIPVAKTTNKKFISEMISRKENETDELETKKTDGKDDDENGTEKKKTKKETKKCRVVRARSSCGKIGLSKN